MVRKGVVIALAIVLTAEILAGGGMVLALQGRRAELTRVAAPAQAEAFIPEWAKPKGKIKPLEGNNLALKKESKTDGFTDVYHAKNAVDGNDRTYWEGRSGQYPNRLDVDLGASAKVATVQLRLNPSNLWEARTQTITVFGSPDGNEYSVLSPAAGVDFDPATGNMAILAFEPTEVRFVRLEITSNTSANAGQIAEFEAYGPAGG